MKQIENYQITGVSNSLIGTLVERIKNSFEKEAFELPETASITFIDQIDENRLFHYWYGGSVVHLCLDGEKFEISARGDVIGSLYRQNQGQITDEVARVKDKGNLGGFFVTMAQYLKTDEELTSAMDDENYSYMLDITDNNWWECEVAGHYDCDWVLDSSSLFDAIIEVIKNYKEMKD